MLFVAAGVLLTAIGSAQDRPISVCETIRNRKELDGKMIAVRGLVGTFPIDPKTTSMDGHGAALIGRDCGKCFEIDGIRGPCGIHLALPSSAEYHEASFGYDDASASKVRREIEQQVALLRRRVPRNALFDLTITYVGMLEARPENILEMALKQGGDFIFGFGHLGGSPVQLLIKEERDPHVSLHSESKEKR